MAGKNGNCGFGVLFFPVNEILVYKSEIRIIFNMFI